MERVYFPSVIALSKLHLNDMNRLVKIEEKAFTNIVGNSVVGKMEGSKCFYLYMSNCRQLSAIHESAFEGTAVCMVSNNLLYLYLRYEHDK